MRRKIPIDRAWESDVSEVNGCSDVETERKNGKYSHSSYHEQQVHPAINSERESRLEYTQFGSH